MKIALSGSVKGPYYFREDGNTGFYYFELQKALESEENKKLIEEKGGLPIRYLDKDYDDILKEENIIGYASVLNFKEMYAEVINFDNDRLNDVINNYKVGFMIKLDESKDKLYVEDNPYGSISHLAEVPSLQLTHIDDLA